MTATLLSDFFINHALFALCGTISGLFLLSSRLVIVIVILCGLVVLGLLNIGS